MRFLLIAVLCAWSGFLLAQEKIETLTGEWKESRSVKKLHDTPMGAVYRFTLSDPYYFRKKNHNEKCDCKVCRAEQDGIRGLLQFNFQKSGKKKRFVVFEFRVRAFPALSQKKTPEYQFKILSSGNVTINRDYSLVNGIFNIRSDRLFRFSTASGGDRDFEDFMTTGNFYKPNFEPHSYRVIIDTDKGREVTVICNSWETVRLESRTAPVKSRDIRIRTFGIISQDRGISKDYRREYLEFSNPIVRTFDSPELLAQLPPIHVAPYPYGEYGSVEEGKRQLSPEQLWRKVLHHDNPDLQYAYALELLYGKTPDPAKALELLGKAAKTHHIPALYQLGVCSWRGYGTAPDRHQAERYLKEAEHYRLLQAPALLAQIGWVEHRRPLFTVKKRYAEQIARILELAYQWQNHAHDLQALSRILHGETFFRYEVSPKIFNWQQGFSAPEYLPGYYQKALALLERKETQLEDVIPLLKTGADGGDPDCAKLLFLLEAKAKNAASPEAFTPQNALRFGDTPEYHLLEFAAKNPRHPGIAEFLADRNNTYSSAETTWRKGTKAENRYLLGLLLWLRAYSREHRFGMIPAFDLREAEAEEGFELLKQAAEAGIPAAQYLVGRQYVNNDIPNRDPFSEREKLTVDKGKDYLKLAAPANLNASFRLLELAVRETDPRQTLQLEKLLPGIETFCTLKYGPAFLLKGELLKLLNRPDEAWNAFAQAAINGEHTAYREVALLALQQKDSAGALELWRKFIPADRRARAMNHYDLFYPEIRLDLSPVRLTPEQQAAWSAYQTDILDEKDDESSNRIRP